MYSFTEWFNMVILPHCNRLPGTKILLGDNLKSHFSYDVLKLCESHDIKFICLPPNATHLAQPLDVAVFRPMKRVWSDVVIEFKKANPKESCANKIQFPGLLKKLLQSPNIKETIHANIRNGFKATGIYPPTFEPLLKRLSNAGTGDQMTSSKQPALLLDSSLTAYLKSCRYPGKNTQETSKKRGARIKAGQPIPSTLATNNKRRLSNQDSSDTGLNDSLPSTSAPPPTTTSSSAPKRPKTGSGSMRNVPLKVSDFVMVKVPTEKGGHRKYLGQILEVSDCQDSPEKLYKIMYYQVVAGSGKCKFTANQRDVDQVDHQAIVNMVVPHPVMNHRDQFVFESPLDVYN